MRPDDYANCVECEQARPVRVLKDGVCPWCTLSVILSRPNPLVRS